MSILDISEPIRTYLTEQIGANIRAIINNPKLQLQEEEAANNQLLREQTAAWTGPARAQKTREWGFKSSLNNVHTGFQRTCTQVSYGSNQSGNQSGYK